MLDYIKGRLIIVDTPYIVVEVQDIGYQIHCPNPFIFQKHIEQIIIVYTYQYVREDVIRLYGFQSREERSLFEKLLNVSGIGPKGALAILAAGAPEQVIEAIETENEQFLIKFPGVGKKTARQIILDLKGKLHGFTQLAIPLEMKEESKTNGPIEEAIEALKALGYIEKEIKKVLPELQKDTGLQTDEYIKKALQLLLKH